MAMNKELRSLYKKAKINYYYYYFEIGIILTTGEVLSGVYFVSSRDE